MISQREDKVISDLEKNGYAIMNNVLTSNQCDILTSKLETLEERIKVEKETDIAYFLSERNLQFYNVHYQEPEHFLKYIDNLHIINVMQKVLKDKIILSNFNASKSLKTEKNILRIHIDSRKPNKDFSNTYQMVAMICLDDFNSKNGSTVVVPRSHLTGKDPRGIEHSIKDVLTLSASKGSIIFIPGQTWHDVGQNISGERRWAIIAYYSCWWIKPTYDFVNSCNSSIFKMLNNTQKELLGFNSRPPINWKRRQKTISDIANLPNNYKEALNWDGNAS